MTEAAAVELDVPLLRQDTEAIAQRVRAQPAFALLLLVSSALLGVQLWLFMWAPLHGKALPVSLGYFLLPLVNLTDLSLLSR